MYIFISIACLLTFMQFLQFSKNFPTMSFVICFIIKVMHAHYRIFSVMGHVNLLPSHISESSVSVSLNG